MIDPKLEQALNNIGHKYRVLNNGEVIQKNDEYYENNKWSKLNDYAVSIVYEWKYGADLNIIIRRKLTQHEFAIKYYGVIVKHIQLSVGKNNIHPFGRIIGSAKTVHGNSVIVELDEMFNSTEFTIGWGVQDIAFYASKSDMHLLSNSTLRDDKKYIFTQTENLEFMQASKEEVEYLISLLEL